MHFSQQFYIKRLFKIFKSTDALAAKIFVKIGQQLTAFIGKIKKLFFKKIIIYQ